MTEQDNFKKQITVLEQRLSLYEKPGTATLHYALNRKMNEMAEILNGTNLKNVSLDDAKDKTFDRLKAIWSDSKSIAEATKMLGDIAGVTGDEIKDTASKRTSFLDKAVS